MRRQSLAGAGAQGPAPGQEGAPAGAAPTSPEKGWSALPQGQPHGPWLRWWSALTARRSRTGPSCPTTTPGGFCHPAQMSRRLVRPAAGSAGQSCCQPHRLDQALVSGAVAGRKANHCRNSQGLSRVAKAHLASGSRAAGERARPRGWARRQGPRPDVNAGLREVRLKRVGGVLWRRLRAVAPGWGAKNPARQTERGERSIRQPSDEPRNCDLLVAEVVLGHGLPSHGRQQPPGVRIPGRPFASRSPGAHQAVGQSHHRGPFEVQAQCQFVQGHPVAREAPHHSHLMPGQALHLSSVGAGRHLARKSEHIQAATQEVAEESRRRNCWRGWCQSRRVGRSGGALDPHQGRASRARQRPPRCGRPCFGNLDSRAEATPELSIVITVPLTMTLGRDGVCPLAHTPVGIP